MKWLRSVRHKWLSAAVCAMGLVGCASAPTGEALKAETEQVQGLFPGWENRPMPAKRWVPFNPVMVDGQLGLEVISESSLSLLRKKVIPQHVGPATLKFSWWVDRLIDGADLSDGDASDAPAQVLVAFDGNRDLLSAKNQLMSELTLVLTGEELPYASLVYAWSNEHPVGSIIIDPRTDRMRYLVVEQGPAHLKQWVHHERDVLADFRLVFKEEPGPIGGLAIMTDTDNTRGNTRAVFGPVQLSGDAKD